MVEHVTIDTPEHVAFSVDLADLGSRFLAIAVDTAIQGTILFALAIVFGLAFLGLPLVFGPDRTLTTARSVLAGLGLLAFFVVVWGYHIVFETWGRGQSPGKRVFGLRVVKDNGAPVGFLDAVIRNIVRLADMLPSSYAVGVLTILLSKQHKRLGDMAAGTLVVHEPRTRSWVAASGIDPALQRSVADFLDRAEELDPEARDRIAVKLAGRLGLEGAEEPGQALVALSRLRSPVREVG